MDGQKAILVLNGDLQQPDFLASFNSSAYLKIAVDGGLKYFRQAEVPPDILMGDLDSVSDDDRIWAQQQAVQIIQYPPEKDQSDFELALSLVLDRGISWIRIMAALGNRIDHTIANCFLLLDERLKNADVRLDDGKEEVCLIRKATQIEGQPGDVISLIPLQPLVKGVLTHRLKYPLLSEDLLMHQARGISNIMLESSAAIEVQEGILLCIHTRQE